jgi:hypothetical protein
MLMRFDGSLELLTVLPTRTSMTDPEQSIETVPTTVAKGPDGAYYIGELTGWPYYKGEARVWRVMPGHEPSVYADGFTNIVDLTFDEQGRLGVLEMAKEGMFDGNPGRNGDTVTGRLVRIERNGTRTDLATAGLENPGGVVYAGNGTYYVTNRATGVGTLAGQPLPALGRSQARRTVTVRPVGVVAVVKVVRSVTGAAWGRRSKRTRAPVSRPRRSR